MNNQPNKNRLEWFNQIYHNSHIGILVVDKERNIIDVNPNLCKMFGYKKDEALHKSAAILHRSKQTYEKFSKLAFSLVLNGEPIAIDYEFKRKDGTTFWARIAGDLIENKEEVLWTIIDISESVTLAQKLQAKSQLLLATQTLLHTGTWELNLKTKLLTTSDEFCDIMGFELGVKITLEHYLNAIHPDDRKIIFNSINVLSKGAKTKGVNLRVLIQKDNHCEMRYVFQKGEAIYDKNGEAIKLTGATLDITDQKETELLLKKQKNLLEHQAFHDYLTGLPNRALLLDRLEQTIQMSQRTDKKIAILFIDLDDFKSINDSLGHDIGDQYLIEIAKKIKSKLRASDTIARIGGDEFVILLNDIEHADDIIKIINEDINLPNTPLNVSNQLIFPQMSIGIAMYPSDGTDTHTLLKHADAAMYKAKNIREHSYSFYDSSLTKNAYNRMNFSNELKQAIEKDEFLLYYQPQVNAKTNKLIGMEALIRWQHPTKGFLSPAEFLPMAEELGLIIEVNRWVMKTAFNQLRLWHTSGKNHGKLSINMAAKQLECPECYPFIKNLLKGSDCQSKWITFELIEGQIMTRPKEAIERLEKLCELGFTIDLDDFGTGYSSLSYLTKLPLSRLKIDKSFIDNIPLKKDDMSITKTIIELAKNLNLDVIAEGVEKEDQKKFLLEHGCDNIQGYLYSKPLSVADAERFMDKF